MSSAAYAVRRNQNLYRNRTQVKLGPAWTTILAIAVIGVLALLYLTQITKTGVFGYKVSDLTNRRDSLATTKEELDVQAARLQSIQQIQSSSVVSKMVPETKPVFASK